MVNDDETRATCSNQASEVPEVDLDPGFAGTHLFPRDLTTGTGFMIHNSRAQQDWSHNLCQNDTCVNSKFGICVVSLFSKHEDTETRARDKVC